MAPRTAGVLGTVLMCGGSLCVMLAVWTHRGALGDLGLVLWLPGIVLYTRWYVGMRRGARAAPGDRR